MSAFIEKNRSTLILCLLGMMVGATICFVSPRTAIFRVIYEFRSADAMNIPPEISRDTLFMTAHGRLIRNFTTSYTDTLRESGISRGELKIQVQGSPNESERRKIARSALNSERIKILVVKEPESKWNYKYIFYGLLTGLFAGTVISFFSSRKAETPRNKDITTPI